MSTNQIPLNPGDEDSEDEKDKLLPKSDEEKNSENS